MSSTLNVNLDLLNSIEEIALKAGDKIMEIYSRDFEVVTKEDASPLTEADLASHHIIKDALTALTPNTPLLSEESAKISWEERKQWQEYWLIDPIDGTKEFINKNDEFTVNIALIRNGIPCLGVVFAPALTTLYSGISGEEGGNAFKTLNGERSPIKCISWEPGTTCIAMGSRSHPSPETDEYLKQYGEFELTPAGSSLKFCKVAEGSAHVYPRFGPTCEWDTGAADAVLRAAGGKVINAETGEPVSYNAKESLLNPFFIAMGAYTL